MKKIAIAVLALIICLTFYPLTYAAIINVPADYPTIQGAINASINGDEIVVQPGIYDENIDFKAKAIVLRSTDPNDPDIIDATIIDGKSLGSAVKFVRGENANTVLSGFKIKNGNGTYEPSFLANVGGGILCKSSSPIITNCVITENSNDSIDIFGGGIMCLSDSSATITNCTISGNSADGGGGILCSINSSPLIENCQITNNSTTAWNGLGGGGIGCYESSSPTITNCTITGNSADTGGGIYCYNSSPVIGNCQISNNSTTVGSGLGGGGIACEYSSSPAITNCTISGNSADGSGGIGCYESSPVIENSQITNNSTTAGSGYGGGGIGCEYSSSPAITNCTISGNSADGGGGIGCYESSPVIENSQITNNSAIAGSGLGGGGISCYESSLPTIMNAIISGNTADAGGGIYCYKSSPVIGGCQIINNSTTAGSGYGGGGISCYEASSPTITDCIISGNTSDWGGGILCYYNSSPAIGKCEIITNSTRAGSSYAGGGIYCEYSSSPILTNSIISGNTSDLGGGILCHDSSPPKIANCTISSNISDVGGGIYCENNSDPNITSCIIWYNEPDDVYIHEGVGLGTVIYSCIQGGYPGVGNIGAPPLFIDTNAGDFHLQFDSPCVDTSDPNSTIIEDREGNPRPFDGNWDGIAVCDMGAYEYICPNTPEVCDRIDNNCDGRIDEGFDEDGDGFTTCAGDCDDTDPNTYEGAHELCDGIDNDCNDKIDDNGECSATTATLCGSIINRATGAPADGVMAKIMYNNLVTTGSSGTYSILGIPEGGDGLLFTMPSEFYKSYLSNLYFKPGRELRINVALPPQSDPVSVASFDGLSSVSGYVYDKETGTPVAKAKVTIILGIREQVLLTADSNGFYSHPNLKVNAGIYKIKYEKFPAYKTLILYKIFFDPENPLIIDVGLEPK